MLKIGSAEILMDDNIAKLFKHAKEKAPESLRKSLPVFRFKDERARKIWDEYLLVTDPHRAEVARIVATWASSIDNYFSSIGLSNLYGKKRRKVMAGLFSNSGFKNSVYQGRETAMSAGVTTQEVFNDALGLMEKVSVWGKYVARLERNARLPDEGA